MIGVPVTTTIEGAASGYVPEADQAAALDVTARFVDAWYAGGSDQAWRDQVSRWADPTLAKQLPTLNRDVLPGSRRDHRAGDARLPTRAGQHRRRHQRRLPGPHRDLHRRRLAGRHRHHRSAMTTAPSRRWAGLLLGLAGVLLTGCTMAGARGATINTISRPTTGAGDCPPATVTGTAPGLDPAQEANAKTVVGVALGRGLGPTGAAIAVAAALAESSLYNYANDGTSTLVGSAERRQLNDAERAVARQSLTYPHDKVGNNLDSIGLFQQRPMTGWGTPDRADQPRHRDRQVPRPDGESGRLADPLTVDRRAEGAGLTVQRRRDLPRLLPAGHRHRRRAQHAAPAPADGATGRRRPGRGRRLDLRPAGPARRCGGGPAAWGGYQNGRIPATALCPVPSAPTLQLECGAATAFDQLNTAFKAQFGQNIGITDGYRSYDEQVHCRLEKGSLCANPGTSNHGWGKAVDIGACCGVNSGTGPAFDWLTTNASRYGWNHPAWAQAGGSKPEPWHWEYGAIS